VSDALHAVALLDETNNGIDLVMLDLNLPRLGGDQIMEDLPQLDEVPSPFIIMSGCFSPITISIIRRWWLLQKPISNDTLKTPRWPKLRRPERRPKSHKKVSVSSGKMAG